jgi:1,4-alpha-glucan branching enzyme
MGTEYAQFREWDYENSLEWFMLDYDKHKSFRDYVSSLNRFYLERSELWEQDFTPDGFEWILADAAAENSVAFRRYNSLGESVIVIINFSGVTQRIDIKINSKKLRCLFDTHGAGLKAAELDIKKDENYYLAGISIPAFSGYVLTDYEKIKKITLKEKRYVL